MKRTLYFGGPILTMDKTHPVTEALLTENGRIKALGALKEFENIQATRVDLEGHTLMPAFVDGHSHLLGVGVRLTKECSLVGCTSFAEILQRIRTFAAEKGLTHGEPITCKGYDLAIMEEDEHPTAALLDTLGLTNPIACIHLSGHVSAYNTVAMERAGVLSDDYECPEGGFADRNADGTLNGYFEETARAVFSPIFRMGPEDLYDAALAAQQEYLRHGFTTVQEGSRNSEERIGVLEKLATDGKLQLDVVAYMDASPEDAPTWERIIARRGRDYKDHLKIGGVKTFLDGSPQVRTAWLRAPYEGEKEYRGYPTMSDKQLEECMRAAAAHGLQVLAHCNGDAASEQFLSTYERLDIKEELRPVMVHSQTVGHDQLERMAKVGMMPSFFVGHCYYWGDTHLKNLGERGRRISPTGKAHALGIPFSFHQDSPVTPPDMLHSVWCAVNRVTRNGVSLEKAERLSPYDALIAATRGGAYTYFEEETKGILKEGALADLVILSADPTAVPQEEIKDIKVLATIKEDVPLYLALQECSCADM